MPLFLETFEISKESVVLKCISTDTGVSSNVLSSKNLTLLAISQRSGTGIQEIFNTAAKTI